MRRATPLLLTCCLCWLAGPARSARAEFIPWKYNWTRNPAKIMADEPGTSYIELSDERLSQATGSTDVVATNLRVVSTVIPTPAHPHDTFTNKGYSLTLFLLDVQSNVSGQMTFTGVLNGTASATNSQIKNAFTGETTQERILGGHRYTVTIGPYTPPGPPDGANTGAISAYAQVTVTDIQKSPEPSTIVLVCCAAPFGACSWWRRRRGE